MWIEDIGGFGDGVIDEDLGLPGLSIEAGEGLFATGTSLTVAIEDARAVLDDAVAVGECLDDVGARSGVVGFAGDDVVSDGGEEFELLLHLLLGSEFILRGAFGFLCRLIGRVRSVRELDFAGLLRQCAS